jgi:redox-sensitive bicupin YhaK (pirin superfamily)
MSWQPADEAAGAGRRGCPAVETVIVPRSRDLGGFSVRRALPACERRMVGPFIFFDQMGPAEFLTGTGIDVRPHPHIGLSTVTWLIEGAIMHRDSVGSVQEIRPGEVNWMTAGRGIAHSERTPDAARATGAKLFGLQTWLALPGAHEETDPGFVHIKADALPVIEGMGAYVTLIAGTGWGATSPVPVFTDTIYGDAEINAGGTLPIAAEHEEMAVYVLSGQVEITGDTFEPGSLLVLAPDTPVAVKTKTDARVMVLGGATADGPRHIWWNFVSSRADRIEQAKADWQAGRFDAVIGDGEFIPLPEN